MSLQEDEILSFPLLLIPQRTGHLLYPSVEITGAVPCSSTHSTTEQMALEKPSFSSETDYRSQSEALLVVSNLSSTTVGLDSSHSIGGTWLVESKVKQRI